MASEMASSDPCVLVLTLLCNALHLSVGRTHCLSSKKKNMAEGMKVPEIWLKDYGFRLVSSLSLSLISLTLGEANCHVVNVEAEDDYPMRAKVIYSELARARESATVT